MLYDIIMTTLIVSLTAGMIWVNLKISKAAKEGKIKYTGKVRIERPTRLDKQK
jgi:hypothetical protein